MPSILDAFFFVCLVDLFYGLCQLLLEVSFLKFFCKIFAETLVYIIFFFLKTFHLFKATCCYRAVGI